MIITTMSSMKQIFEYFFIFCAAMCIFTPAYAENPIKVVVFGDSIVSGMQLQPPQAYPARLEAKMREIGFTDIKVINMTKEGMTTSLALDRTNAVIEQKPDVVIVAFGVDDVERGATVEQIYNNLITIAGRLTQTGAYVILTGIKAPSTLGYNYVKQFENMYQTVSTARKTLLVPDILVGVAGNSQLTLADSIHPSSRGVDAMVENSYRHVDTCVRTKLQAIQYREDYKAYQQDMLRQQGR